MRTRSSSAGSWCPSSCSEACVDSELLLLMISLRELSRTPGPFGGHQRRKMTLGRQRADSGVHTQAPRRVSGDTVGSAAPHSPKAVPSGWHRLSASRTLLLAPESWCCAKGVQHPCVTPSHPGCRAMGEGVTSSRKDRAWLAPRPVGCSQRTSCPLTVSPGAPGHLRQPGAAVQDKLGPCPPRPLLWVGSSS